MTSSTPPPDPEIRVIPCLLLRGSGFVKTVRFDSPRYLGDPVNIVHIFNEKEVDEVCILDIEAGETGPRLKVIRQIADECFMPASYGGGIDSVETARQVLAAGFEKVVFNTAAARSPSVIEAAAQAFGSQSVVVSIDVATSPQDHREVRIQGGTVAVSDDPVAYAQQMVELGAGEILLTSIDRDGTQEGYDLDLVRAVASAVPVPVIACGGARDIDDLVAVMRTGGAAAAAAGSLFVFYGRLRAVLVNPPPYEALREAWRRYDDRLSDSSPPPSQSAG